MTGDQLQLFLGGVAALFVETGGVYCGRIDVDPWDVTRDALRYDGPWPVIAHPPCARWCQLARLNQARYGHQVGDDAGAFVAALDAVRRWGGVLEHPAYSLAWPHHGLPVPERGGWTQAPDGVGMVASVCQGAYGHPARKRTWLYAVGVEPLDLDWREVRGEGVIGGGINSGECVGRPKVEKGIASRTPPAFRDALITLACSALRRGELVGVGGV